MILKDWCYWENKEFTKSPKLPFTYQELSWRSEHRVFHKATTERDMVYDGNSSSYDKGNEVKEIGKNEENQRGLD